jgi:hypothetical protein
MKGKILLLFIILCHIWLFFYNPVIILKVNYYNTKLNLSSLDSWNRTWEKHNIIAEDISLDSNEDIFIVGYNHFGYEYYSYNMCLIKFDKLGNFQWDLIWDGGGEYARAHALVLDTDDNIYVTGNYDDKIALVKFDSLGQLLWEKTYNYSGTGYDIALDQLGNIYITGYKYDVNGNHVFFMKTNSSGHMKLNCTWNTENGVNLNSGRIILLDGMGNIYIAGKFVPMWDEDYKDLVLLKYNNSGHLQWNKTWGDGVDVSVGEIEMDNLGNVYVSGYAWDLADWGAESENFVLIYDTFGILQKEIIWKKGWNPQKAWVGVIFNNTDCIYIAENTPRYTGNDDICVIKCDNSLKFEELWLWGEPDIHEEVKGIVIDSLNNIYLLGEIRTYNYRKLILIKNPDIFIPVPNLLPILIPVLIIAGVSVVILNLVVYEKYLKRTSKSIKFLKQVSYSNII